MSNKKYYVYQLAVEYDDPIEYTDYRTAYREYCKKKKNGIGATLWGVSFEGEYSLIRSH